ncbi:sodium/hydrogen exchanger family protein [Sarocladium implicatum]|nr:sodium/hydrogen exchanger family protein [Sarocladium implicatum]
MEASLPYHEPGVVTILTQSSFLILLNVGNYVLDLGLYCGLLGQVLLGVAFGTPGAKWLGTEAEHIIVQLGYLGLLLLVYEGGLSTSLRSLKANIWLSSCVAVTGIALPMGFSFVLQSLTDATPLQAFAAGAALCSTSLGTTFTVLGSSGLMNSRLGVVLTSAAMMDDVVGLVMVQIISNLGGSDATISPVTVVRPLAVSVAFAICAPILCFFVIRPVTLWLNRKRVKSPTGKLNRLLTKANTAWIIHTLALIGSIAGSTYAGTSNLFASYIAGACISWWDAEVPHPVLEATVSTSEPVQDEGSPDTEPQSASGTSGSNSEAVLLRINRVFYSNY